MSNNKQQPKSQSASTEKQTDKHQTTDKNSNQQSTSTPKADAGNNSLPKQSPTADVTQKDTAKASADKKPQNSNTTSSKSEQSTSQKNASKQMPKNDKPTAESLAKTKHDQSSTAHKKTTSDLDAQKKPDVKEKPTSTMNKAVGNVSTDKPEKAKGSGKLATTMAVLLGMTGTGLGAYAFKELRTLKSSQQNTEVVNKINAVEAQLGQLSQQDLAKLADQLSVLQESQATVKANSAEFKARINDVEQMQSGLEKTVTQRVNTVLDSRMHEVDVLLEKVKDIELGQQGLAKNINTFSAASEAVTQAGMVKQEAGYLIRMANYKLQSEGDVAGATGLLQMANDKLAGLQSDSYDSLIQSIRTKIVQLQGVKVPDTDGLITQLKSLSREVPNLVAKKQASANNTANESEQQTDTEDAGGDVLDKIGSVIASGVKYTPKDPSKIDISAETILIEKRLLQADLRTAELAVRSKNKILLAESISSIRDSVQKYFAADQTANTIVDTLGKIERSELDSVLPDLSILLTQFNNAQQ